MRPASSYGDAAGRKRASHAAWDFHQIGLMFSFLKDIFGINRDFDPLEMAVLDKFAQSLPEYCRAPWIARLEKINLVQRIFEGREVNCYQKNNGKVVFDSAGKLFESNEEVLFGKMQLSFHDGEKIDVELRVFRGYFFSMEFSAPMKKRVVSDMLDLKLVYGPAAPAI